MYTPRLRDDQIHQLYKLAKLKKSPMMKVLWAIFDEYLKAHEAELAQYEAVTTTTTNSGGSGK
jgi:hypothetical protein